MTRTSWLLIVIFVLLFAVIKTVPVHALGMAKLTLKVIDEEGQPLEGAKVVLHFQGGDLDKDATRGETNYQGIYSASGYSSDGVTGGGVYKDDYYKSVFAHDFYVTKLGMWQPWGKELTVVMRPIVNPVPMYVRNRYFDFPWIGKEIGFDLEKADWVIPYGLGTHADFIFKMERRYDNSDNFDATMTLTFSNPFDGIQIVKDDGGGDFNIGSWFRLPRMASESGYQSKLEQRRSRGSYGRYDDKGKADDNNFIFRVRSEVDENGKLKRAMYGKIRGDIQFAPVGSTKGEEGFGGVGMHYYLNPDYTTNLEFDPKRNLFIKLSGSENVTQP